MGFIQDFRKTTELGNQHGIKLEERTSMFNVPMHHFCSMLCKTINIPCQASESVQSLVNIIETNLPKLISGLENDIVRQDIEYNISKCGNEVAQALESLSQEGPRYAYWANIQTCVQRCEELAEGLRTLLKLEQEDVSATAANSSDS